MNKERLKGILTGVAASCLALGLSVTAFAANRNISVSDGIRVLVNGQAFQPKDGNGAPVELFSYNGTVYAPVRAICEEAGLTVAYDAATQTVSITKPTEQPAAPATTPAAPSGGTQTGGAILTEEQAKQIALDHAGVRAADAVFTEVKLEQYHGSAKYELEFYSGSTEYDYEIDAATKAVLKFEHENRGGAAAPSGSASSGQITEARAREIALERAPGATVVKCKLDHDDGRTIYELELRSGWTEYECEIDASTGTVLKWEVDD